MIKTLLAAWLVAFSIGCGLAAAQNGATPMDTSDGSAAQPAFDDVSQPGQIHGYIPETWIGSMITLVDLQTQDGQDWLTGLTAAQSAQSETQYVCQNPGPTTTSADNGDFYFYDLPAGSYVVGACMQTADGHWRSGAQVVAVEAGQDDLVALGPAEGSIVRDGQAFIPNYYVGLWDPMLFGPSWPWGWHLGTWQPSIYYHAPVYRSAPIWVRPASIGVGVKIFVPPYKLVIGGGYHYLAYRNGGFARMAPRPGVVLPPHHEFHPITPEAEARRQVGTQVRPGGVAVQFQKTGYPGGGPPSTAAPARSSPFVNYHPTPPAAVPSNNAGTRSGNAGTGANGWQGQPNSQTTNRPTPQVPAQRPVQQAQPPQIPAQRPVQAPPPQVYHAPPLPHNEYHAPPAPTPKPAAPAKRP
jgi:hypothetical protein